jgi:hypothetical protein
MKLRIKGNSIRLRLTKSDVEKLCIDSFIEESTYFGDTIFKYSLQSENDLEELSAKFEDNALSVYIPSTFTKDWNTNDVVGLGSPSGNVLSILVEKDFKCLDETTEDQSDNFENPHNACQK